MQDLTQDRSDRNLTQAASKFPSAKRLGSYLVEAGLLSPDQIKVILIDQQATGMRFGEIAVARGWLKEQTIEWIVEKVVVPDRQTIHAQALSQAQPGIKSATYPAHASHAQSTDRQPTNRQSANRQTAHSPEATSGATASSSTATSASSTSTATIKSAARRDIPISKPLPSVNSADNDVYWVG